MVKNTYGGNKHKKFARKRDESGRNTINNLKKTQGQEYGFITKVLGNCKFNITCYDKKERIGHVRGKLRKRTWFVMNDVVLISLRDFQDDMCDMIQKYSYDETNMLITNNEITESFGKTGGFFKTQTEDKQANISFLDEISDGSDNEIEQEPNNTKNTKNTKSNQEDEINIADLMGL